MNNFTYHPDPPTDALDAMIATMSGAEPQFDSVMQDFLRESYVDLKQKCSRGGLLEFASFGLHNPWLFRLTFTTRGFIREPDCEPTTTERHVVALRFLPDYLRNADRFAMVTLIEPIPTEYFHPNVSPSGPICVEIYPGESLVEICQSLHDLFRWRLRQYDERDALNPVACVWGRENIDEPIDQRPLFGKRLEIQWQNSENSQGDRI